MGKVYGRKTALKRNRLFLSGLLVTEIKHSKLYLLWFYEVILRERAVTFFNVLSVDNFYGAQGTINLLVDNIINN